MGLPQFETAVFASQIFWLVLCVFFLLLFVKSIFIPRVISILETREKRIQGDLDKSREIFASAQKLQSEYNEKIIQNKIKARHQKEGQLAEFEVMKSDRMVQLQRIFTRKRLMIEKGKFLNIDINHNFIDILLKK